MTFSAMGSQLVDFVRVVGLPRFTREHIGIEKRKSRFFLHFPLKWCGYKLLEAVIDKMGERMDAIIQDVVNSTVHINCGKIIPG